MTFLKSIFSPSLVRGLAAAGLVLSLPALAQAQTPAAPAVLTAGGPYVEMSPADEVAGMGAGVNINAGWEGFWNGTSTKFKPSQMREIKAAGFNTVRIPLQLFGKWSMHIDAKGLPDPQYLKKLDGVVDAALQAGLYVIIDEHDFDDCAKDPDGCSQILPNLWDALAAHYRNAPSSVMFELLNEPHEKIDAATWNAWIPQLLSIVRETNPTRNVVIGPTHWNSLGDLPLLQLPADPHIIVTFHYYNPMTFSHQGANWVGPEIEKEHGEIHWKGTPDDLAKIASDFDQVAAWARANNRPILLGEFGTYGKFSAMDERAAWTRAVSKAAAARGFARAYWYFDDDANGFRVYNSDTGKWVQPLKDAILLK